MTLDEVVALLSANIGRRVRVTFGDGVIQSVDIGSVDGEGFTHSGPDGVNPNYYWTRLDSVSLIELADADS